MDPTTLQVWSWLGTVLGTLVLAVAVLWAGKQLTVQALGLWHVLWAHESHLKAAVDEPTDTVNQTLARVSGVSAEVWAALLPAMLEALVNGLTVAGAGQSPTATTSVTRHRRSNRV